MSDSIFFTAKRNHDGSGPKLAGQFLRFQSKQCCLLDRCPINLQVTALDLNWNVDFVASKIHGRVILSVERLTNSNILVLDTSQLHVAACSIVDGQTLEWNIGERHEKFGSALQIDLTSTIRGSFQVSIDYSTHPESTALQWLSADQTHTRKYPYLFTQCQAIHARSLLPCQDSPAIKAPYTASVTVPAALTAVMSALPKGEPAGDSDECGSRTFKFSQPVPVPSYLIALGVGLLQSIPIGPRSVVWSEPGMVERGAWEFEETEKFIDTAEQLISPYCWQRYDLLLLPPSFPYGGMENPCLTFVTPTIVAGDRSLVDVVAHEISHSWAGNLVTNKNWQHFWLNEGFCVFIERKIVGRLYGEQEKQLHAINGWKSLEESIKLFGNDNPLTSLVVDLRGVDPDDAFSSVPYEKGFNFLNYLEQALGGPAIFEPYVKAHYANFEKQSITTEDWKSFLYAYFGKNHPDRIAVLDAIDWHTWLHKPGMPPIEMPFDRSLANACTALAKQWNSQKSPSDPVSFNGFSTGQKMVFLDTLISFEPLPHEKLTAMDALYQLSESNNTEIRFRWCQLCLRAKYEQIFPSVIRLLTEQGRMKFTRPLYRSLNNCSDAGKQLALETFTLHQRFYHPICAQLVAKDLGLAAQKH